jgi:hypothetical protein
VGLCLGVGTGRLPDAGCRLHIEAVHAPGRWTVGHLHTWTSKADVDNIRVLTNLTEGSHIGWAIASFPTDNAHVKDQICSAVVGTANFNTIMTANLQLEYIRAARQANAESCISESSFDVHSSQDNEPEAGVLSENWKPV